MFALWTGPDHASYVCGPARPPILSGGTARTDIPGVAGYTLPAGGLTPSLLGRSSLTHQESYPCMCTCVYMWRHHLWTYMCVYLSVSRGYLRPVHCRPRLPLAPLSDGGSALWEFSMDRRGKGGLNSPPTPRKACGSQTPRAVPGCSIQALPGKPFPRKSSLRCDRNLAQEGGVCRHVRLFSTLTFSLVGK